MLYYGLTINGQWIWFKSGKPVHNCKQASEICGETITKVEPVPLFFRIFRFYLNKEYKRG